MNNYLDNTYHVYKRDQNFSYLKQDSFPCHPILEEDWYNVNKAAVQITVKSFRIQVNVEMPDQRQ